MLHFDRANRNAFVVGPMRRHMKEDPGINELSTELAQRVVILEFKIEQALKSLARIERSVGAGRQGQAHLRLGQNAWAPS